MPSTRQWRSLVLVVALTLLASTASTPPLCRIIDWATKEPPGPSTRLLVLLAATSLWSLTTYLGALAYVAVALRARVKSPPLRILLRALAPVLAALAIDWLLVLYKAAGSPIGLLEPSQGFRILTAIIYIAGLAASTAILVHMATGSQPLLVSLLAAFTVLGLAGASRLVAEYLAALAGANTPVYACRLGAHGPGTVLLAVSPASLTGSALYIVTYIYSLSLLLSRRRRG